ncbi:hypothetical protein WN944_006235 [Citrus x changshan-huyou]|uniref:Uncharacterized protein n=1 Tax=Citrus x changshan-huyou TaxID=2935761 RepID=A0AAP0QX07_9ROSI
MLYRKIKNPGQFEVPERPGEFLKELSLHEVRLGSDSVHWRAQQTNLEYPLDVNRLIQNVEEEEAEVDYMLSLVFQLTTLTDLELMWLIYCIDGAKAIWLYIGRSFDELDVMRFGIPKASDLGVMKLGIVRIC